MITTSRRIVVAVVAFIWSVLTMSGFLSFREQISALCDSRQVTAKSLHVAPGRFSPIRPSWVQGVHNMFYVYSLGRRAKVLDDVLLTSAVGFPNGTRLLLVMREHVISTLRRTVMTLSSGEM